jgi:hypothetical protein
MRGEHQDPATDRKRLAMQVLSIKRTMVTLGAVAALAVGTGIVPSVMGHPPTAQAAESGLSARVLMADDLPRGYSEVTVQVPNAQAEMHLFVRMPEAASAGPAMVMDMAMECPVGFWEAFTPSALDSDTIVQKLAGGGFQVSDWHLLTTPGIGEGAAFYGFHYQMSAETARAGFPAEGEGSLGIFSRGSTLTWLMVLSPDSRAAGDLESYARLLDARIVSTLTTD